MRVPFLAILIGFVATGVSGSRRDTPRLLRWPTVSQTQIAFSHADDLWIVPREGGDARRLTNGIGAETRPLFSPDGSLIAFTGAYDGNTDVYLVPATGGDPRRLTYPPDDDVAEPGGAIYGPKVMIINQFAGSGGDALPWYFRKLGIGPILGTRTWGGLVGIGGYPALIDGGYVMAPRAALYGLTGEWEVENRGIPPDIEVEMDPKAVSEGHDPQLEKAVEVVMELLKKSPTPTAKRPTYPNYDQRLPASP